MSGKKVLLYHSDRDLAAPSVRDNLVATGLFGPGDIATLEMTEVPPSLATFQAYDCVIVWTNFVPPSPAAQGTLLQQYVDAGGGVVLMTYGYSRPEDPWELQGGIMQSGYSPLRLTTLRQTFPPDRTLDFSTALTAHPVLSGVSEFTYGGNTNYVDATLDEGATRIGSDNLGNPLVAVNSAGNVSGINLYPGPSFTKSPGVFRTIGNACISVSDPTTSVVEVPAGEPATVTVTEDGKAVAGIDIPAGTFGTDVTVTVEFKQLAPGVQCHDYLLGQVGRCLEVTALTADGQKAPLLQPVTVGACLPSHLHLDFFKFETRQDRAVPLRQVEVPFLDCDGFQLGSAAPSSWLGGLATGLARHVGGWLAPKPLYAANLGFGGEIPAIDGLSSFTWASPVQIASARLAADVFDSGRDAFAVAGTFKLLTAKGFDPFSAEAGFDPARDAVTLGFGRSVYTIPVNSFRYSDLLKRWVYAARTTTGITAMAINPLDGTFTAAASIPTEGALPAYRAFTLQVGHRVQGAGLLCDAARVCVRQEPVAGP